MSISNVEAAAAAAEVMPTEEVELNEVHAAGINFDKVDTKDGEEGETVMYSERALLYRFADSDNTWKERARGDVQLLKNSNGRVRVVMRAEKIHKVRLNHFVGDVDLKVNAGSDKAWTWRWNDYASDEGVLAEPELHSFAIRFRTTENAAEFKAAWEKARAANLGHAIEEAPKADVEEDKKEEKEKENPEEQA